jgi:uncharacterized membrane protein YvlD (DUF360 family)
MVGVEHGTTATQERKLPPISEIAVATMVLVVIGGVFMAAHMPKEVPLALPIALLTVGAALLAVNVVLLSRVRDFAWDKFRLVGGWSLAAYVVIAGMLEYVFIKDDTPNDPLLVLTGMLLVYAIDIPLLFGFSVARYQPAVPQGD